jgi:hypothetical protein
MTIVSLTPVSTALTEARGQQTTSKLGLTTPSKWLPTTLLVEKDATMPAMRRSTGRITALYAEATVWLIISIRFKLPILT